MVLLLSLFLGLAQAEVAYSGHSGDVAEVSNLQTIPFSPPVYSQANSYWCTLFSSHLLLQQNLCLSNGNCGESNQVSLRSLIASGVEMHNHSDLTWKNEFNAYHTLEKTASRKSVAESCARSADFLKFQSALKPDKTDPDWGGGDMAAYADPLEKMRKFYADFKTQSPRSAGDAFAACGETLKTIDLRAGGEIPPAFARDLCTAAIQSSSPREFLLKTLEPTRCESTRIDPKNGSLTGHLASTSEQVQESLQANLRTGHATLVGFCQDQLVNEAPQAGKCKWPHSIVVADSRQVCAQGECRSEYRLLDPDFKSYKLPLEADNSVWVPAETLLNGVALMGQLSLVKFGQVAPIGESNMMWFENPSGKK